MSQEQILSGMLSDKYLVGIVIVLITIIITYLIKSKSKIKLTPIQKSAFELLDKGKIQEFKQHMQENQINPNLCQDFQNLYLLHKAVSLCLSKEAEGLQAIEYLVSIGAEINCQDKQGRTPIFMASHWSLRSAVTLLSKLNADLNQILYKSGYPMNPLYTVLLKESYKMSWFLIEKGASIDKIEEIHNKTTKFKLGKPQLEFIEKCKITLKRTENKKKILLARLYQIEYQKQQQKQEQLQNNEGLQQEQQSTFLAKLNHNELNEILNYYL